jgi:hypothetical protein
MGLDASYNFTSPGGERLSRKEEGSLLGAHILARFRSRREPPLPYDFLYPTFRGPLQPGL